MKWKVILALLKHMFRYASTCTSWWTYSLRQFGSTNIDTSRGFLIKFGFWDASLVIVLINLSHNSPILLLANHQGQKTLWVSYHNYINNLQFISQVTTMDITYFMSHVAKFCETRKFFMLVMLSKSWIFQKITMSIDSQ